MSGDDIPKFPEVAGMSLQYIAQRINTKVGNEEKLEFKVIATNLPDKPVGSTVTDEVLGKMVDITKRYAMHLQNENGTFWAIYDDTK